MLGKLIRGMEIIHAEDPDARIFTEDRIIVFSVDFPRFSKNQLKELETLGFRYAEHWGQIWRDFE